MKAQSRLLNDISHELRSPLARLNVALGLGTPASWNEKASDMLDRIELEASRLNELIGRILTLARLEDGEQLVPQTPVPLGELVESIAEDAEFEAQARHCHVTPTMPEGEWMSVAMRRCCIAPSKMWCANAIRYTHEGTSVEVELSGVEQAGKHRSGAAGQRRRARAFRRMPSKLFEPFYRLDDARGRLDRRRGPGACHYRARGAISWRAGRGFRIAHRPGSSSRSGCPSLREAPGSKNQRTWLR